MAKGRARRAERLRRTAMGGKGPPCDPVKGRGGDWEWRGGLGGGDGARGVHDFLVAVFTEPFTE